MTQPKWKRGDLVRATSRLMFGQLVIPKGTQIRIEDHFSCFDELVYQGNANLPDGERLCYPLWADDLSEENE